MKIAHVTVQTDRFEEEIGFYEKYIGLQVVNRICPGGKNIVFMAENQEDLCIEIIDNPEAACAGNENLSIGFHGGDKTAIREALIADGFKNLGREVSVTCIRDESPYKRTF